MIKMLMIEIREFITRGVTDISFRPEDHPEIELPNRNLPFVVKLPIE
jgi:hypothetical protein